MMIDSCRGSSSQVGSLQVEAEPLPQGCESIDFNYWVNYAWLRMQQGAVIEKIGAEIHPCPNFPANEAVGLAQQLNAKLEAFKTKEKLKETLRPVANSLIHGGMSQGIVTHVLQKYIGDYRANLIVHEALSSKEKKRGFNFA